MHYIVQVTIFQSIVSAELGIQVAYVPSSGDVTSSIRDVTSVDNEIFTI